MTQDVQGGDFVYQLPHFLLREDPWPCVVWVLAQVDSWYFLPFYLHPCQEELWLPGWRGFPRSGLPQKQYLPLGLFAQLLHFLPYNLGVIFSIKPRHSQTQVFSTFILIWLSEINQPHTQTQHWCKCKLKLHTEISLSFCSCCAIQALHPGVTSTMAAY